MSPKNVKFTMIPVSLVSNEFSSILDDAKFKILMFYYLKNNVQFRSSYYGYKALTTEGYYRISQNNYKRVMASLEAKKLISTEPISGNRTIVNLLMIPMIDASDGSIYQLCEDIRTGKNMSYHRVNFIAVPLEALDIMLKHENGLSSTEIKLMIRLYRFYVSHSSIYAKVLYKRNNEIFIEPRILHDLSIDKEQAEYYLDNLEAVGLFTWNTVKAHYEKIGIETRIKVGESADTETFEIDVAIPTWTCDWENN
jgi:hypothetical protein